MNRFKNWKYPSFDEDGWTEYGWRCQEYENLKLGENTDIGCFTYMNAKYGIEIGEGTQIGPHCTIHTNDTEDELYGPIKIGKNCLIGAYTFVFPNTIIKDNSKIRARSNIK